MLRPDDAVVMKRTRRALRFRCIFSLVCALVLLAAGGAAHASTVSVSGTTVLYVASSGESNVLTFSTIGNDVIVDDSVTITAGAGCTQGADTTNATCSGTGLSRIDANTDDLDDTVSVSGAISLTLFAGPGDDTITGSGGNDALYGEAGIDTINGGDGGDLIDGGADGDVLRGQDGDDTMSGGAGDDQLEGDDGVDRLDGGPGADTLNGGNGSDWVAYTSSSGAVTVDISDPGLDGGPDDGIGDQLSDLENIRGSAFADTLTGNNIPNEIDGGAGADAINGGTDQDIVTYAGRATAVVVDLNDPSPDGGAEDGTGDTLTSIEGARGGNGADTLTGDSGANTLDGQGGDDMLNGLAGADYLVGGTGFDTADYSDRVVSIVADLDGASDDGASGENDRIETDVEAIIGGSGADVLGGNNGANTLDGGPGDDVLGGALGADVLIGGAGIDSVSYVTRTGDVTVTLDGVADDGELAEGDNVAADVENVTGGLGDDTIVGSSIANTLLGGPGDDTLYGGAGADLLSGGIGVDTVDYSTRTAAVSVDLDGVPDDGEAGEGDNVVTDIENITGGSGPDLLRGGGGANRILGGPGADDLDGLSGPDTIEAGAGADTIQAKDGTTDVITCGDGHDILTRDTQDVVVSDCEDVDGGGGFVPTLEEAIALGGVATPPASIAAVKGAVSVNSRGIFRLRVKCPKKARTKVCKGALRLKTKGRSKKYQSILGTKKARSVTLAATKRYKIRRGKAKWVRMKLSKKGKRIVLHVQKVKARVISKSGKGKKARTRKTTITLKFNKNARVT